MEQQIQKVVLIRLQDDSVANETTALWAADKLVDALKQKGVDATVTEDKSAVADDVLSISLNQVDRPEQPESFIIAKDGQNALNVAGADARGLSYALLELADRVQHSEDAIRALLDVENIEEQPANKIRAIMRLVVNETDDEPWLFNKEFWQEYLDELALHRFNRLHLSFGATYDLGHNPGIEDYYFAFVYPYFVSVPGYDVSVSTVSEEDRQKNLEMLRYIASETKKRGLDFQLGIWSHAYEPVDSPNLRQKVSGLTPDNHAEYCRDALKTLLQACPEIDGITIRIHYESGIPEPAHLFWKVVLKGIADCGRKVNLDVHPKGLDDILMNSITEHGLDFDVSPKFWAEHLGLPYQQAGIRATELPIEPTPEAGTMIITTTSRRFTRYGYADFLNEERNFGVFHRIWPGTQRVLLWGDPEIAGGYGRAGSFCDSKGVELFEPLSFKSRKTSEQPGGRDPYKDESLRFNKTEEWKKYKYSYRVWGRKLYNPNADADTWRRYLKSEFKDAALSLEEALKNASKVLPYVTVAHHPSAANNNYWVEMYYNMQYVDTGVPSREYGFDSPPPHTFNAASPLDPVLFYIVNEFADDVLNDELQGKINPLESAHTLEQLADRAEQAVKEAERLIGDANDPEFRRWVVDIKAQIGLGRFFAHKFRTGAAYAFFERTGASELLERALASYRDAKQAWQQIIDVTQDVYADDITFGFTHFMRGHWADRMKAIDEDIVRMENQRSRIVDNPPAEDVQKALAWLDKTPDNSTIEYEHEAVASYQKGQAIPLQLTINNVSENAIVRLKYRIAHQAEAYETVTMQRDGNQFSAEIPASYTNRPYPINYFFEVIDGDQGELLPGFDATLSNHPYYTIRLAK